MYPPMHRAAAAAATEAQNSAFLAPALQPQPPLRRGRLLQAIAARWQEGTAAQTRLLKQLHCVKSSMREEGRRWVTGAGVVGAGCE